MPRTKVKTAFVPKVVNAESDSDPVLDLKSEVGLARRSASKRGRMDAVGENRVMKSLTWSRRPNGRLTAANPVARKPLVKKGENETAMPILDAGIGRIAITDSELKPQTAAKAGRPKRSRGRPIHKQPNASSNSDIEAQHLASNLHVKSHQPNSSEDLASENSKSPRLDFSMQVESQETSNAQPDVTEYYLATYNTFDRLDSVKSLSQDSVNIKASNSADRYIDLESRYRDLKGKRILESERNFDRLKTQTESRSRAASELIAKLKTELACLSEVTYESEDLRAQLHSSRARVAALENDNDSLAVSLAEALDKVKSLTARITINQNEDDLSARPSGNVSKYQPAVSRNQISVEKFRAVQLKEELYADLTGLLIRDVKCGDQGTVYDCIQTGRNGTLHFKLFVSDDGNRESIGEEQVTYKPQLDNRRDADLIDLLPDYLVEEITFSRPHAAKFYARVTKSLTEDGTAG